MVKFVDVETPYMDEDHGNVARNILYARACVRDSLMRGETPFALNIFYSQPGIIDDSVSDERRIAIQTVDKLIGAFPDAVTAVYEDLGISKSMQYGIDRATLSRRKVEFRKLGEGWLERELAIAGNHSQASVWGIHPTD